MSARSLVRGALGQEGKRAKRREPGLGRRRVEAAAHPVRDLADRVRAHPEPGGDRDGRVSVPHGPLLRHREPDGGITGEATSVSASPTSAARRRVSARCRSAVRPAATAAPGSTASSAPAPDPGSLWPARSDIGDGEDGVGHDRVEVLGLVADSEPP